MSDHSHDHDHGETSLTGMPRVHFREYMIGFGLSVVLTAIPFWLVLGDVLENRALAIFYVISFGTVQMIVHMVYFLHMNTQAEKGWFILSMAFTVMLVFVAIAGSVWIMFHLDQNMMPGMMEAWRTRL